VESPIGFPQAVAELRAAGRSWRHGGGAQGAQGYAPAGLRRRWLKTLIEIRPPFSEEPEPGSGVAQKE
jgi:hypothetical protein